MAVQMELAISSGSISGIYYYEKIGEPLELKGNISQNGKSTIDEIDEKGQKTGTFRGRFATSQQTFEGTWSSADKKKSFPFKLTRVAEYVFLRAKNERCWSIGYDTGVKEEGPCSLHFEYPRFLSASPGFHQVNTIIKKRIMDEYNDFISRIRENDQEKNGKEKGREWYNGYTYSIVYYAEDLVSVLVTQDEYAGGARSHTAYEAANFWVKGGKATSLNLADLFLPRAAYIEVLSAYCINDLREREASWVVRGDILRFTEADLRVFSISPRGIDFSFAPYAVGSGVEGSYFVNAPYKVLTKIIHPEGPLKRFVALTPASDRTQRAR